MQDHLHLEAAAEIIALREQCEALAGKCQQITECFEAARHEGLNEQLSAYGAEPGNLIDLVLRRLSYAEYYAQDALTAYRQFKEKRDVS